jgi:hypothetical protein
LLIAPGFAPDPPRPAAPSRPEDPPDDPASTLQLSPDEPPVLVVPMRTPPLPPVSVAPMALVPPVLEPASRQESLECGASIEAPASSLFIEFFSHESAASVASTATATCSVPKRRTPSG